MSSLVQGVALGVVLLAVIEPLTAQQTAESARQRGGFYASIGAGRGEGYESCSGSGCSTESVSYTGPAFYIAIGGAWDPRWAIGFEGDVWTNPQSVQGYTMACYSAMLTHYLSRTSNAWIKVGPGYITNSKDESGNGTSYGFTGGLGIGYDWMLKRSGVALIPYVTYLHQFNGSNVSHGTPAILKGSLFMLGLGIGYRR